MSIANYFNGPLNIDRPTQLSSIGGPLGDHKFSLISAIIRVSPSWWYKGHHQQDH